MRASQHNRSDRRRIHTREALIAAARQVFGARGVESATIQEITDVADVAKGSFYNHFADAGAILGAVVEETLAELGSSLETRTAPLRDDAARVVSVSLRHTLRLCTEDRAIGWFVLRAADLLGTGDVALGAHGRRDLRSGVNSGRFRCDDLELMTTIIAGSAQAVIRRRLQGTLPPSAEIGFVAHVLTLLGVPGNEALSIASEDLPIVDHPGGGSDLDGSRAAVGAWTERRGS